MATDDLDAATPAVEADAGLAVENVLASPDDEDVLDSESGVGLHGGGGGVEVVGRHG